MAGEPTGTTSDSLYGGAVMLRQPARGYRVNVDALLLAAFAAQGRRARLAVDLGAGVGAVSLGLHHLAAAERFALVERDGELLTLAGENARGAACDAELFCADLGQGLPDALLQRADLVVSNPPFFEPNSGRQGPEAAKSSARFGHLEPFMAAAAAAANGTRARIAFVYPARELCRALRIAERCRLVPKRLRLVHADTSSPARVVLIELRAAKSGGLEILPPLFEWIAPGTRTPELAAILAGGKLSVEARADDRT